MMDFALKTSNFELKMMNFAVIRTTFMKSRTDPNGAGEQSENWWFSIEEWSDFVVKMMSFVSRLANGTRRRGGLDLKVEAETGPETGPEGL